MPTPSQEYQELLKKGINAVNKKGETPLILAAKEGLFECVRELVESKADLDTQDLSQFEDTALTWAIDNGHIECTKLLINVGANLEIPKDFTPLDCAVIRKNFELILLLFNHGAVINNDVSLLRIKHLDDHIPASVIVSRLKDRKEINRVDDHGRTPLIVSATSGNSSFVKALIEAKADLNKQDSYWKDTALSWAVYNGHLECAKLLIEAGADCEIPEWTPFAIALYKENSLMVNLLLTNGVMSKDPKKLHNFLRQQDKNNENTYIGFLMFCEQQKQLREDQAVGKNLLDDATYIEAESYLKSLPYPKEKTNNTIKAQVILAIDDAIQLPKVLTALIDEYDNHFLRLFKPVSKNKKASETNENQPAITITHLK